MNALKLISPKKKYKSAALDYKNEHFANNEFDIHGSSLLNKADSYKEWLVQLRSNSRKKTVNKNWVVSSTFFAVRKSDGKIVGMVDVRHELNDFLREYGGQIGYGVRPSERNKGYAVQMLNLSLEYCKKLKLEKVMLACYKDNIASQKTILKCGGILECEFLHTDGKIVQKYWITC